MSRGQVTEKAQEIANKFLGENISICQLRLIPYLHYVLVNGGNLDYRKVNDEEREILAAWTGKQHLILLGDMLIVTREFWDFMNDILWETYVKTLGENNREG